MSDPVSIELFYPLVFRECAGIPEFTVQDAVLRACRDFCQQAQIWKETLDTFIPTIPNIPTYELDGEIPDDTRVVSILSMRQGSNILTPKTVDQLDRERARWRELDGDQSDHFVQETPETFMLVPFPKTTAAENITDIRVALKPTMDATTVGAILYNDYEHAIAKGALAVVQALPKKSWSNPKRANENMMDFQAAITEARIRARKDFSRASLYSAAHCRFGGP